MGCCGWPARAGGITPGEAQAGITVARTTSFNLDGTVQNPTFNIVIKADTTGNFAFTPGTDVITIKKTGSHRVSVYLTTHNACQMYFKLSLQNNGVEIPNIATFCREGTDQPGIDDYQLNLSIEAINLTAGTVKVIVQEVTTSGTATNSLTPNIVWSIAQNSGIAGANGTDAPGAFSRDEFQVYLDSDTATMNASTQKNAFKNAAQTASKMVVLYDKGSIVDAPNAKIIPTIGTWDIHFFLKVADLTSNGFIRPTIVQDPAGTPVTIYAGTESESGGSSAVSGQTVSFQIKTDGTKEFAFFYFSNDTSTTVQGGPVPLRTYVFGDRINTDPT